MRLKIELFAEKQVKLPIGFNVYFQALIYKYLNVDAAAWLHNTGFRLEEKTFKTHYYTPFETEFSQMVDMNLGRKWKALFKKECPYHLKIKPLFHGNGNERIFYFGVGEKRTLIKGWKGVYLVEGDPRFLDFGYASGFGSHNTNGCGLVESIRQGSGVQEKNEIK
jgi:CRISPR/Cas system endoribonuclease Cas6 (RAMP superfamily)